MENFGYIQSKIDELRAEYENSKELETERLEAIKEDDLLNVLLAFDTNRYTNKQDNNTEHNTVTQCNLQKTTSNKQEPTEIKEPTSEPQKNITNQCRSIEELWGIKERSRCNNIESSRESIKSFINNQYMNAMQGNYKCIWIDMGDYE